MNYKKIYSNWKTFAQSNPGRRWLRITRILFTIGIFAFLFNELNKIGWVTILKSLPTTPWFYLIFLLKYFALPISEQFIYRLSLKFTFWEGFKIFMIKKILNSDIIAYSGEAFLFGYGKKFWKEKSQYIFNVIKDNNIISAFTSTLTAILLLTILTYFGQVNFLEFLTINTGTMIGIGIFAVLVIGAGLFFRKKIISFDTPTTIKIFGIHQGRILLVYTLDVLQCIVALPLIPYDIWFTFLAIQIIYTRIPFLPSQDILLLGIYAKITEIYDFPQAEIMAVYIMIAALVKLLNLVFYSTFALNKMKLTTEKNDKAVNTPE